MVKVKRLLGHKQQNNTSVTRIYQYINQCSVIFVKFRTSLYENTPTTSNGVTKCKMAYTLTNSDNTLVMLVSLRQAYCTNVTSGYYHQIKCRNLLLKCI